MPLRIGILKADSVLDEFKPLFGDYPGMFEALLAEAADEPPRFVVYDVVAGEYPAHLGDCDAYVITGSRFSVYDDEAWIVALRDFVVQLHECQTRLVGICFGHQMVAHALDGHTEPAEQGWGVGVHRSRVVDRGDFMDPAQEDITAIVSHKDQVTRLPSGAKLLATSEFCPYSMYQLGDHILCFQGHPEFVKPYSKRLMDLRRKILGEDVYRAGVESLSTDLSTRTLARWMIRFMSG